MVLAFPFRAASQQNTEAVNAPQKEAFNEEEAFFEEDQLISQQLYEEWKTKKDSRKTYPPPKNYNPCSCVSYARWYSKINVGSIGLAKNHPINSNRAKPGAIVITSESHSGHVAVVLQVNGDEILITEANYKPCQVSQRTLSIYSPLIRGYYE